MPIRAEFRPLYKTPQWLAARETVKQRARDRCERCHARHGAVGYRTDRGSFIEIAPRDAELARMQNYIVVLIQCGCCHRNNVPGDDRLENLAWWCRGCHLRHDRPHHRNTRRMRKDRTRPLLEEAV